MIFIALGIFCGIVIGALCAPLHCRVYVILAVSAFLAAGATVGGVIFHAHLWTIAAEGIGLIAASQFGYVAVGLTLQYFRFRAVIPQMQASIGQNLRAELKYRMVCRLNCLCSSRDFRCPVPETERPGGFYARRRVFPCSGSSTALNASGLYPGHL